MVSSNTLLDGVGFVTSNRSRIAISLLHLSIEHQKGIHVLVGSNVNGSAFALLRPQFEAYVRGLWFNRCSTEKDLEKFISGKEPPRINNLIDSIEKTQGFTHGALGKQKKSLWKGLNDFTHGGASQVKSRNTDSEIIGNYKAEYIEWLLNKTSDLSLLAGLEIAGIANNHKISKELLLAHKEIYEVTP
jgi:hypothetical protein